MVHGVEIKASEGKSENEAFDAHCVVKALPCCSLCPGICEVSEILWGHLCLETPPLQDETPGSKSEKNREKGNSSRGMEVEIGSNFIDSFSSRESPKSPPP